MPYYLWTSITTSEAKHIPYWLNSCLPDWIQTLLTTIELFRVMESILVTLSTYICILILLFARQSPSVVSHLMLVLCGKLPSEVPCSSGTSAPCYPEDENPKKKPVHYKSAQGSLNSCCTDWDGAPWSSLETCRGWLTQLTQHWVVLHWGWFVPNNRVTWECHSICLWRGGPILLSWVIFVDCSPSV